jgi:hypothetical protein
MTETLKKITPEQVEKLKMYSTEEEIEKFFLRLNYNFGDGEVLSFEQIQSFFVQGMNEPSVSGKDWLTIYIDTVRMLKLYDKDVNEVLNLNKYSVEILHNKLVSEFKTDGSFDIKISKEFKEAVAPFVNLSGTYGHIKVELIATIEELNNEGSTMNHCIASYYNYVIEKHYIGFRVFNDKTNERLTLGCYRLENSNTLHFNQLKGNGNWPAKKDSCLAIIDFCNQKDIKILDSEAFDLLPANS